MMIAIKFNDKGQYVSHCTDFSITDLMDIRPSGEGFAFYETDLNLADICYFKLSGNNIVIDQQLKAAEAQMVANDKRKAEIQAHLKDLSEDLVQDIAGEEVPHIAQRKEEFIALHNELRVLLAKPIRVLKVEA